MSSLTTTADALPDNGDSLPETVMVLGRPLRLSLSRRARKALANRTRPLWVEMELYFSCLVRKQVRFSETEPAHQQLMEAAPVTSNLNLLFRPVVTEHCLVAEVEDKPDVNTMPVNDPGKLVPHWLQLDYRGGKWWGEFGY